MTASLLPPRAQASRSIPNNCPGVGLVLDDDFEPVSIYDPYAWDHDD